MEGCSSTGGETFNHYKPSPGHHHNRYHVFLSGGVHIRKSLVDHLFESLSTAGFDVFLGNEEPEEGENIDFSRREAIRNSTVHIPFFSADYARSARRLYELSLSWTCKSTCTGTTIIPLFYNVEPSDVRYPDKRGPYVEAFQKHREEGRSEKEMDAWKKALYEVSLLSGWSLATTAGGSEGRLVKLVVMDLFQTLNINSLYVAKHPEGLSDRVEEIRRLLEMDNHSRHVLGVVIWGMGGLGKTTLAKAVYNKIHSQFQASCFVSDVRASTEKQEKQGLLKLQKQILRDLAKVDKSILKKWNNVDHVKMQMENHLRSIQALVILDDVDEEKYIHALVGDAAKGYWFGRGSRIIITTRDYRVLQRQVDVILYEMKGLDQSEGMKLFCWHSFFRADPAEGYQVITEKIVNACQGVPLSLEVVGAHLYGEKNRKIWSEALTNLVKIHKEVYSSLKISYDALLDEEKRMFLDIVCFFIDPFYVGPLYSHLTRYKRYDILEFYVKLWEALGCTAPRTCLRNLEGKSLIRIDYDSFHRGDSIFWMHDHLRDLARQIIEVESRSNPVESTRLWRYKDFLSGKGRTQGMPKVEGLVLDSYKVREKSDYYSTYPWELMQNLKFMFISNLCHEGQPINLPPKLVFLGLRWCRFEEDESASKAQPISFCLRKTIGQLRHLRFLDISNTSMGHLPNELRGLFNLEELYLSGCDLMELPQWLGNLIKLTVVDVSYNDISSFPANFDQLKSLIHICAKGNLKLQELSALPSSVIELHLENCIKLQKMSSFSHMKKLEVLGLCGCTRLTKLPSLGSMHSLKDLKLEGCVKLQQLPSLPYNLSYLSVSGCQKLQVVSNFSQMKTLEVLDLSECTSLTKIPSLDSMHSLKDLRLEGCVELQELPALPDNFSFLSFSGYQKLQEVSSFSHMKKLEVLDLSGSTSLRKLPSLDSMHSLKELKLQGCVELQELPALPDNLSYLSVSGCQKLQVVSSFSQMKTLEVLDLSECTSLTKIPSLDSMHSLKDLRLEGCVELQELPVLPDNFSFLSFSGYQKLQEVSSFSHMKKLEVLDLSGSTSLRKLPSLDSMHSLKELKLQGCVELQELPALPDNLSYLSVSGCQKLQVVSSFSQMKTLEVLDLSECTSLTKIPSLDSMHSLKYLRLEGCVELQELPALPDNLSYLSVNGCQNLQVVSSFSQMKKLKVLDLSQCTSLTKLPSLDSMHSLRDLNLHGCVELQELPALPENFRYVSFSGCEKLQELSNFSHMKNLKVLDLSECTSLTKLPSFDSMHTLKILKLERCVELQELSSFSQMKTLEVLDLSECTSLTKIPSLDSIHSLKDLKLERCVELQELPPLPDNLIYLCFSGCEKLQELSSFSHMKNLKVLDLSECTSLTKLPSFNSMHSLKNLKLERCVELQELPPLPDNLSYLSVSGCEKLQEVSNFSHMKQLEVLDLSECTSLTKLPSLDSMHSLKDLKLEGCVELQELPAVPYSLSCLRLSGCQKLQEVSRILI